MDEHNRPDETVNTAGAEPTPAAPPDPDRPRSSYSKKTRALAWLGVAFMVFLVIMYTYSLASGKIMLF